MKKLFIFCIPAFLMSAILTFGFLVGCKKTVSPLGLNDPSGFDVPSPTPLPLSGAIVVNLSDSGTLLNGATVVAVAPGGASSIVETTNGQGQASFNPNPIAPGVWAIDVPQQTISAVQYDLSQQFVTVSASFTNANLNFSTGAYNVSLIPLNGTTYPTTLQNNLPFAVDLIYTGTLSIPVSLSFPGNPYSFTGGPLLLDASVTQAGVTFQVPACSITKPSVAAKVTRTNNSSILWLSSSVTIERGYPVSITTVTVSHNPLCQSVTERGGPNENIGEGMNDTWTVNEVGECPGHSFHVHVAFSPVATVGFGGTGTSSEDFTVTTGSPVSYSWIPYTAGVVTCTYTITDLSNSVNTWSSSYTFDPHYQSGGSCNCGNGGYTGCGTNTLSAPSSVLLNP